MVEVLVMIIKDIVHSCRPGKLNITAPLFEEKSVMQLPSGKYVEYRCSGCGTVINVYQIGRKKE